MPALALLHKWVVENCGCLMRVEKDALRGTVFVGLENNGTFTPLGTAFIGAHPLGVHHLGFLITARHVVEDMKGDIFSVRLNRKEGGSSTIKVKKSDAYYHSDKSLDLVMFPFRAGQDIFDYVFVPLDRDLLIKSYRDLIGEPGIGDEVITIGLYTSHYGTTHNYPVVRVGHIAMMPGEPVRTIYGECEAILVEMKSIGGLSGSPVFMNVPRMRVHNKKVEILSDPSYPILGICVGYHVVQSAQDTIGVPQFQGDEPSDEKSLDERNTGFAVVIPYHRILEIMESDKVKNDYQETVKALNAASGFRTASAPARISQPSSPASDENPTHLEDFNRLLGAASQKPKQAD